MTVHRLSRRRATTTRCSPKGIGYQKQTKRRGRPYQSFLHRWLGRWMPYNFVADIFRLQEKCEFKRKTAVLRSWAFFGGLWATYNDHLRLIGKLIVDLVLIELFSRCYGTVTHNAVYESTINRSIRHRKADAHSTNTWPIVHTINTMVQLQ